MIFLQHFRSFLPLHYYFYWYYNFLLIFCELIYWWLQLVINADLILIYGIVLNYLLWWYFLFSIINKCIYQLVIRLLLLDRYNILSLINIYVIVIYLIKLIHFLECNLIDELYFRNFIDLLLNYYFFLILLCG